MLAYRVPNGLYRGAILHQSSPSYHWEIIGYLTEHMLQEINFLVGRSSRFSKYTYNTDNVLHVTKRVLQSKV